jgi:hypothetical protein
MRSQHVLLPLFLVFASGTTGAGAQEKDMLSEIDALRRTPIHPGRTCRSFFEPQDCWFSRISS